MTTSRTSEYDVLARLREPETLQNPYPFYAWLREHAPVHRNPTGGVYLVSRNATARVVYQSPDLRAVELNKLPSRHPRWERSRTLRILSQVITSTNPPEHTRIRRAVSRHFTLRQTQRLRAAAESRCERLLASLADRLRDGDTADLHHELTQPLGMNMAGDIIGIPEADRETLASLILQVLASLHPDSGDEVLRAGDRASEQVEAYFTRLADERRRHPREDLISALLDEVHEQDSAPAQGLTHSEFMLLLWGLWAGSFETTVAAMGFGVLAMMDHPDQAHWLDGDPAEVQAFVAETLRYNPPVLVDADPRIASRDIELDGVVIPEGADVRPLHGAANRDPAAFPEPDRFDPARNTSRMVTFGHGVHHCLGANLARMECAVALTMIRRTLPGLSLPERPVLRPALSLRTFERFPVAL